MYFIGEMRVLCRRQPGEVIRRVPHRQVGPAGDSTHPSRREEQIVFVDVPVDHGGIEAPQRDVFQRMLPSA